MGRGNTDRDFLRLNVRYFRRSVNWWHSMPRKRYKPDITSKQATVTVQPSRFRWPSLSRPELNDPTTQNNELLLSSNETFMVTEQLKAMSLVRNKNTPTLQRAYRRTKYYSEKWRNLFVFLGVTSQIRNTKIRDFAGREL